jgi:hypothetical protein
MSTLDRRSFMGRALTFSAVSGFAGATSLASAEQLGILKNANLLVLYRASSSESAAFAASLATAGLDTQALQEDIVRQWRTGLDTEVMQQNKLLLGMGNWDDYTLIKGLAAEARRFPLLAMQHPLKLLEQDWTHDHAQEVLALVKLQDKSQLDRALTALGLRSTLAPQTPSLFSWIIG